MSAKPPLGLSVVAIAADGSETTWWSGDRRAYNRPQGLTFRTRVGEGFSDASLVLPRRTDRDWNDLALYNTIVIVGDDGRIVYEGRISGTPRSTQGGHTITVQVAGFMAHAKDRKFTEVYADADSSSWDEPSLNRKIATAVAGQAHGDYSVSTGSAGIAFIGSAGSQVGAPSVIELVYSAPEGVNVAKVVYRAMEANTGSMEAAALFTSAADDFSGATSTALTADDALRTATGFTPQQFAMLRAKATATHTPAAGAPFNRTFKVAGVYSDHGLATHAIDSSTPDGLYASDVIVDIASRFCPKLNTAGVEDTTLAIPHIAFKERTDPFDAFLLLNGPHGYELAVWENQTLTFRPYDLSDYDWQVRTDQPGVEISLQGDTTADLANYAIVEFDNVLTGRRDSVGPSDSADLEDTSADHPANKHGLDVELTVGLTFPTTPDIAIAFGRSYLEEFNRPKSRGQITVQGHILDRAGHWQQASQVRYGQTIAVVNYPNDDPRLITESSYDNETHTMTISTDNGEVNLLEALVDYIRTGLVANNVR